jgi:hypothetical protein
LPALLASCLAYILVSHFFIPVSLHVTPFCSTFLFLQGLHPAVLTYALAIWSIKTQQLQLMTFNGLHGVIYQKIVLFSVYAVSGYQCFEGTDYLHFQGRPKTLATTIQITNLKTSNLNI